MSLMVSPGELLDRIKGFDLAIIYDHELAPRILRPSELEIGDLGLVGIAVSAKGKELMCWVRKGVDYELCKGVWLVGTCLDPDFICSPEFLSALRDMGLELPSGARFSDLLRALKGGA